MENSDKLELPGMNDKVIDDVLENAKKELNDELFDMIKELIVSQRDWHLDQLVELQKKVIQLKKLGYDI